MQHYPIVILTLVSLTCCNRYANAKKEKDIFTEQTHQRPQIIQQRQFYFTPNGDYPRWSQEDASISRGSTRYQSYVHQDFRSKRPVHVVDHGESSVRRQEQTENIEKNRPTENGGSNMKENERPELSSSNDSGEKERPESDSDSGEKESEAGGQLSSFEQVYKNLTSPATLIPIINDLTFITITLLHMPAIVPTILIPLAFFGVGALLIPIVRVNYFINHKDNKEDGRALSESWIIHALNAIYESL